MNRFLLVSSLAIFWSANLASPIHAQSPYVNDWLTQYPMYSSVSHPSWNTTTVTTSNNAQLNNWLTQYPVYSANQLALPNVVTSNRASQNTLVPGRSFNGPSASVPTLYKPTYLANGLPVRVVPYPSPNIYAPPRYMYVPAPQR
jgi:hypothetical protein